MDVTQNKEVIPAMQVLLAVLTLIIVLFSNFFSFSLSLSLKNKVQPPNILRTYASTEIIIFNKIPRTCYKNKPFYARMQSILIN